MKANNFEYGHRKLVHLLIVVIAFLTYLFDRERGSAPFSLSQHLPSPLVRASAPGRVPWTDETFHPETGRIAIFGAHGTWESSYLQLG